MIFWLNRFPGKSEVATYLQALARSKEMCRELSQNMRPNREHMERDR